MIKPQLTDWLPTTKKEMNLQGWEVPDVILFSADAYVDHPSFGAAVIGRVLQAKGYKVAIVPQPDWHGDFRDFKKLGKPRLFFGIAPGCMDSMVNKYTANKRLRSEDAYTPDGRHDKRPEYPSIVYTQILKQLYPDVPVVLGGIEASLRRLTHFDYWQDRLRKCILIDSHADMIVYGMGELPMTDLCHLLRNRVLEDWKQENVTTELFEAATRRSPINQTVVLWNEEEFSKNKKDNDILLNSHEKCLENRRLFAQNFRHIEEESNKYNALRLIQKTEDQYVVVYPPYPPMTQEEIDFSFDLPYTRLPHPKYKDKRIPAFEMIKNSINIHRGCFGGCAFCTISAHQGKFIMSRSKESIMKEAQKVIEMPDFNGVITDLGGPSANMYQLKGNNQDICHKCKRPSCIQPNICPNLNTDHRPLLDIYNSVSRLKGVKHAYIGSGVRYDLLLHKTKDEAINKGIEEYTHELIAHHVSGRLKVAPEHTSDRVLSMMRKPSFEQFYEFKHIFDEINKKEGLRQQIIPYFISSHPGCTTEDMAELAIKVKGLHFQLEQIQDFTPTPMTVSTVAWYSGFHPYTLEEIFSAKSPQEKLNQRMFFFWYKPEERNKIQNELRRINRSDLIPKLFEEKFPSASPKSQKPQNAHDYNNKKSKGNRKNSYNEEKNTKRTRSNKRKSFSKR